MGGNGSGRVRTDGRAYYSEQHKALLAFCAMRVVYWFDGDGRLDIQDLMQQCWYDYLRRYPENELRGKTKGCILWMVRHAKYLRRGPETVRDLNEYLHDDIFDKGNPIDTAEIFEDTDEYKNQQRLMRKEAEKLPFKNQFIINWHLAGITFEKIGQLVGLTGERCRQIVGEFAENCRVMAG